MIDAWWLFNYFRLSLSHRVVVNLKAKRLRTKLLRNLQIVFLPDTQEID